MAIKNPKALLDAATALPAAIESKLPAGAPQISAKLLEFDNQLPVMPDFPMDLPDLPAIPTLPEMPGTPTLGLGRRYVNAATVRPVSAPVSPVPVRARTAVTPIEQAYTQPLEGVAGAVVTSRGM